MRIRDGLTYNDGAKNKDFPISIGIWAEGVWYEKNVFVFIPHTLRLKVCMQIKELL